jgi:hypothetical protein
MRRSWLAALLVLGSGPWLHAAEPAKPTEEMDKAINRALEFLARTQDQGGGWRNGNQANAAITGLAVMAFLSAGHVPGEGPYGETVEKGIRNVLSAQRPNGLIANATGQEEMYHHGICTLMLAEVAGMTEGKLAEEIRSKLEKAVEIILKAQRLTGPYRGAWRYQITGVDGDISVTGWQLMALRAAKNLGCDVPPERIDLAIDYINRSQDPRTGDYFYQPGGGRKSVACTGTGILALELCGKQQHRRPEILKAGSQVINSPPRWGQYHFFYAIYYCSQATFQLGGNYWSSFRPKLHQMLLSNQSASGCWSGPTNADRYGPNYGTAMGVLALTVEYRYLPIYQRSEEPVTER